MKWAQRKESVFITINVTDIMDPKVEVNASHLTFMYRFVCCFHLQGTDKG